MNFTIVKATFMEVVDIFTIMTEAVEELRSSDLFLGDNLDYVNSHIRRDGVTYIAYVNSEIAGFLIIDIPGEKPHNLGLDIDLPYRKLFSVAHMDSIVVKGKYRGYGLQKTMLVYAEEQLKELGYTDFLSTVHPDNSASLKSFLSLGYVIKATKPKYGDMIRHILHKKA